MVSTLDITQLGGGLTNVLYLVTGTDSTSLSDSDDASTDSANSESEVHCLVRVNGPPEADLCVDRDAENKVSAYLSARGLAPTYFGRFMNGRVEEFYKDAVPLSPQILRPGAEQLAKPEEELSYATNIASALAAFHRLERPEGIFEKEVAVWRKTENWFQISDRFMADAAQRKTFDAAFSAVGGYSGLRREYD